MQNNIYFERDRQAALDALDEARKRGTVESYERAVEAAAQFAKNWYKQPEPAPLTERDLARKRDTRLYREEYESLTPEERAEFEKQYGFSATIRRLAEEARRQADSAWEARELQRQAEELDSDYARRQNQVIASGYRTGSNWDLLFDQTERLEQARRERQEARAKRELAAEAWDEELPRIVATLDAEELAIFNRLMESQPTELDALRAYKESKGHNPLEGVNDSAELYDMAMPSTRGGFIVANEVDELYKQALEELLKGE